jgi:predicted unusual protein kinase regulating ubiquinone biosynthesis (AarF/ABC1/UbiB family)
VELLDFGAVVELPLEFRRLYAELFRTGLLGEQERFLDTARKLGVWNTGESEAAGQALWDLVRACMTAFEREEFDFTDRSYMEVAVERSRVLMKHLRRSTPTRHVLFLHRKLGGLFQIFKQLEVKLDLRPEREKLLKWLQQEGG